MFWINEYTIFQKEAILAESISPPSVRRKLNYSAVVAIDTTKVKATEEKVPSEIHGPSVNTCVSLTPFVVIRFSSCMKALHKMNLVKPILIGHAENNSGINSIWKLSIQFRSSTWMIAVLIKKRSNQRSVSRMNMKNFDSIYAAKLFFARAVPNRISNSVIFTCGLLAIWVSELYYLQQQLARHRNVLSVKSCFKRSWRDTWMFVESFPRELTTPIRTSGWSTTLLLGSRPQARVSCVSFVAHLIPGNTWVN